MIPQAALEGPDGDTRLSRAPRAPKDYCLRQENDEVNSRAADDGWAGGQRSTLDTHNTSDIVSLIGIRGGGQDSASARTVTVMKLF